MNELEIWKKSPYLSVDEAMNLILGYVPCELKFDFQKEETMPSISIPIYRTMIEDIQKFRLTIHFDNTPATKDNISNFVSFEELYDSCWWHRGKLLNTDIKQWLINNKIDSEFFATDKTETIHTPDFLNLSHPNYSYKLAAAVEAWETFNNNPELIKSGKSLKANIEKWLTDNAERLNLIYNGSISQTAIEEIAKIVNWETKGGSPKL